ncbi:hypothetical protein KQH58_07165 [Mycetohabitans sp. B6]|nr:hypothetical protein [Mycetohabitans sp. B6]
MHQLFEARAAGAGAGIEVQALSYADLNAQANRLAHRLIEGAQAQCTDGDLCSVFPGSCCAGLPVCEIGLRRWSRWIEYERAFHVMGGIVQYDRGQGPHYAGCLMRFVILRGSRHVRT